MKKKKRIALYFLVYLFFFGLIFFSTKITGREGTVALPYDFNGYAWKEMPSHLPYIIISSLMVFVLFVIAFKITRKKQLEFNNKKIIKNNNKKVNNDIWDITKEIIDKNETEEKK